MKAELNSDHSMQGGGAGLERSHTKEWLISRGRGRDAVLKDNSSCFTGGFWKMSIRLVMEKTTAEQPVFVGQVRRLSGCTCKVNHMEKGL